MMSAMMASRQMRSVPRTKRIRARASAAESARSTAADTARLMSTATSEALPTQLAEAQVPGRNATGGRQPTCERLGHVARHGRQGKERGNMHASDRHKGDNRLSPKSEKVGAPREGREEAAKSRSTHWSTGRSSRASTAGAAPDKKTIIASTADAEAVS